MYGNFACLCAEYETLDSYKVADVEQTLEHYVVSVLVFTRADVVACNIYLHAAF